MIEPRWIATTNVVFVKPDGARVAGKIRISMPEPAFGTTRSSPNAAHRPVTGSEARGRDDDAILLD